MYGLYRHEKPAKDFFRVNRQHHLVGYGCLVFCHSDFTVTQMNHFTGTMGKSLLRATDTGARTKSSAPA